MSKENRLLQAALYYADHGFYVLPIEPSTKKPAISFANQPALTSQEIQQLWYKNPNYNIALRTVHHFVIDVDTPKHAGTTKINGFKSLNSIPKNLLPQTLQEGTPSGGLHFYYKKPHDCKLQQIIGWLPGIDIKANINNYSLVSPSIKDGKPYQWLNPHQPMVEAPQALIDYILTHGSNSKQNKVMQLNADKVQQLPTKWRGQLINEIAASYEKGTRNDTIAKLAGKLLRTGADPEAVLVILQDINSRFYQELSNGKQIPAPLQERELEKTFLSIFRAEVRNHHGEAY